MNVYSAARFKNFFRAGNNRLDRFYLFASDLFCIFDTEGRFKQVNPAFERILGYLEKDIQGRSFLDFVHQDDRPAAKKNAGSLNKRHRRGFIWSADSVGKTVLTAGSHGPVTLTPRKVRCMPLPGTQRKRKKIGRICGKWRSRMI